MLYSPSTKGFYPEELKEHYELAGTWPSDLIEMPDTLYEKIMLGELVTSHDGKGLPKLSKLVLSEEQFLENAVKTRDAKLASAGIAMSPLSDAVDLGIATKEEEDSLLLWRKYRVALMRMDLSKDSWPEEPK